MYGLENFTPSLASRLRGCLPINGSVLLKVIEYKNVPIVEIFMRTQDQLLISVNNALQNELEIEKYVIFLLNYFIFIFGLDLQKKNVIVFFF